MIARIAAALLAAALCAAPNSGCATALDARRGAHGNLHAELARSAAPRAPAVSPPAPTIVMIEREGVRAIDPKQGKQIWYYPRQVVGHPVGSAKAVYLPLRGNRVVKLDRQTGAPQWVAKLPGEALTGLSVAEPHLLATVVDGRDDTRSRLIALGAEDGAVEWERRSDRRLGAPAAAGRMFVVPIGGSVVALRPSSGRELARVELGVPEGAALDRLRVGPDGTLIVGGGNRFVNLLASTGGKAPAAQRIDTGYGVLFPDVGGLDSGFDDSARLRLDLRFDANGAAPRQGVLLSRNVVLSMRLAPDGRPVRARWVHHDAREFVAMDVGEHWVTLVREDGAIVELDATHGGVVHTWAGQQPARGALLLDLHDVPRAQRSRHAPDSRVRTQLVALLADDNPRVLPAQLLALELLWRADQVATRRTVLAVAARTFGPWHTEAGERLAQHAQHVRGRAWGSADADALAQRLERLSRRPSFLAQRSFSVADLARDAVGSGTPAMLGHIVEHLLHPATRSEDLPPLVQALGTLGGPVAAQGLLTFVRAYHADVEVVTESSAVHGAVDHLARLIANRGPLATQAHQALDEVSRDPFTDPSLRAHTERALRTIGGAPVAASPIGTAP